MKKRLIHVWSVFDFFYFSCTRLQCLEQFTKKTNVFRVRLTRYQGREVILSDGTCIRKNDFLIKIHLHNVRILEELINNNLSYQKPLFLYKKVQRSMPGLALFILHHKNCDQIKGIIGITMIDKGYKNLGFESVSISSRVYLWYKRIALYPIYFLSNSKESTKKKTPTPQYLFMSKNEIINKYGAASNKIFGQKL